MKKIFNHIGIMLSVALLGIVAACTPKEIDVMDAAGLSIKVFFPTKVVAGQPMTVNGSGLAGVREVVFPGGVTVTDIEHVGGNMLRLTAPAGISSAGGKLVVRTADDQAESKEDLTLGNTVVSGFSKQDGEEISGGELLTVFGKDLEFICRAELFDNEGNPLILEDEAFYRKGTSSVILNIPNRILEGTWVGKLYTFEAAATGRPSRRPSGPMTIPRGTARPTGTVRTASPSRATTVPTSASPSSRRTSGTSSRAARSMRPSSWIRTGSRSASPTVTGPSSGRARITTSRRTTWPTGSSRTRMERVRSKSPSATIRWWRPWTISTCSSRAAATP